jgi:hypothetical protein
MSSRNVGQGRVYVRPIALVKPILSPKDISLSYDAWCEGIRFGRSYVSDGYAHPLVFTVQGKAPGDERLKLSEPGKVRVAGICPGTIDTPMLAAACEGWDRPVAELYAEVARRIPVRRLGQPGDIARIAAFLLSDEAGYINGTSIVLDGGTMALPPW